jgi:hypothetical protein
MFSGCLHDSFQCDDRYIPNEWVNDGFINCENGEDEGYYTFGAIVLGLVLTIPTLFLFRLSANQFFDPATIRQQYGQYDAQLRFGATGRIALAITVILIIGWVMISVYVGLVEALFPVTSRALNDDLAQYEERISSSVGPILLIILFLLIGFHEQGERKRSRVEREKRVAATKKAAATRERNRIAELKRQDQEARKWKRSTLAAAKKELSPLKQAGILSPSKARRMSRNNRSQLQKWRKKYLKLSKSNDVLRRVKVVDFDLVDRALERELAADVLAATIEREKKAIEREKKGVEARVAKEKAAKEKAAKEKAAKKKAAKKKAAKEKAAKEKAAKEKAEQLTREKTYFESRFGLKGMYLSKWENEWAKKSVGQKAVRRAEREGLIKAGIESLLIDAYVDGMFEKNALLHLKGVQNHSEPDQNMIMLNMVMSYEHNRAVRMAGLDSEWPAKGSRSWSSGMWFRNNTPWMASEKQIEAMVPGLSKRKTSWSRVKDHFEALVRMEGGCEGIIDRLGRVKALHQFKAIDELLKKEMVEEERKLLAQLVSGDLTAEKVYTYVIDWELTKDENLHALSKILDGADEEAVLFEAGLWQD